ncbi:MAG: hypothetical protein QOG77_2364 [Solirubrobacteraceae bacterium]|jgi:hypothetical protein|nr:hypothetical protein [Solirubrobacteraceae bacterium]
MKFLRNLLSDLVEKRLWPVALVLAGALVAVPFLLGGGGDAGESDVAAVPVTHGATPKATRVRVSEDTEVATIVPTGEKHNPFTQPKANKAAAKVQETTSPESSAPAGGGTGGATTDPATTTPSTTPATPAPAEPEDTKVLEVDLRFGEPGKTKQKAYDDIARLSALPSAEHPIVIFLGIKKDRKTATFLISADATATGDGTCKPEPTNCQTIEMQEDESTFLDIDLGEGVRQFQLDVKSISETDAKDAKKASAARARMSVAGQEFLRSSIESGEVSVDGLDYSEKTGTLTSTPRASSAGLVGHGAYRADVKVGAITRTDVRRLQLLPDRSAPKLLFLGVRDGGRSATFLNLDELPVSGANCKPSLERCERFTLRAGRTALVGGTPVTLASLAVRRLANASAAETARTRVAEVGAELVAKDELDLGDLALDPRTGTLTAAPL